MSSKSDMVGRVIGVAIRTLITAATAGIAMYGLISDAGWAVAYCLTYLAVGGALKTVVALFAWDLQGETNKRVSKHADAAPVPPVDQSQLLYRLRSQ